VKTVTSIILTLSLAAPARPLQADGLPTVFARSGQKVAIPVASDCNLPRGPVALSAFGRLWSESVTLSHGIASFVAPTVRVPVVFRLAPVRDSKAVLGESVVYPEGWIAWDKDRRLPQAKNTQLAAVSVPDWFDTWLGAVGLAVEKLPGPESLSGRHWRMPEKPSLVIVGRKAAGSGPAEIGRLAAGHKTNILVLEADWFGKPETANGGIAILPKHADAALADLKNQDWPLPATFRRYTAPWPGILNRLTWISGPEYPLVEEIHTAQKGAESLRIVLSYVPWQDQLGRCAMADELLLRVLAETAKGAKDVPPLDGRWRLLYPAANRIRAGQRPVLAAALKSAEANDGDEPAISAGTGRHRAGAYVLDLRGEPPPDELLHELDAEQTIEPSVDKGTPLLILGDHPILDSWKWLELDRQQHQSPRPGVIWWPDGSLPASRAAELRLMRLLTECKIFLGETLPGGKQ
jgi:hypothetical protein